MMVLFIYYIFIKIKKGGNIILKEYESRIVLKVNPNNKLAFNGSSNMITYTEEFKGELVECRKSLKTTLENLGCQFTIFNSDLKMLTSILEMFQFAINKIERVCEKTINNHNGRFKFIFRRKGVEVRINITIIRIKNN